MKTEEEIKLVAPKGQTKREEGAERGHEEAFITFAFSSFTFLLFSFASTIFIFLCFMLCGFGVDSINFGVGLY